MADPIGQAVSDFMGGVRAVLMLGFDEPFRAGLVYVGVAALALLPWRRTRPLGLAAAFLLTWNVPWWWGATVSARHFAVFAAVLLAALLLASLLGARRGGLLGRIETVTTVTAVWVFAVVAWVSHAADHVPDGWSRWTMPLALITPVLIPLLLQAQPLNSEPGRRERALITCGIGVAATGLVLFFTVMGLWREDLPWGTLAGIFLTMPFGVIAVASAGVPDASGGVRPRPESVPQHAEASYAPGSCDIACDSRASPWPSRPSPGPA
jgi:hypothetical protein